MTQTCANQIFMLSSDTIYQAPSYPEKKVISLWECFKNKMYTDIIKNTPSNAASALKVEWYTLGDAEEMICSDGWG